MIEALWADIYRPKPGQPEPTVEVQLANLRIFIKREYGVDHVTFLNAEQRYRCIEALKAILARRSGESFGAGSIAE